LPSVVVTGAAGAVGLAIAGAFEASGYRVAGVDLRPSPSVRYVLDLTRQPLLPVLEHLIDDESFEGIVVAHGRLASRSLAESSNQDIDETLGANLVSLAYIVRDLLNANRRNRELRLLIIGSRAAETGATDQIYAAAKGGARALARSIARGDGPIISCVVEPGPLDSPMNSAKPGGGQSYVQRSPLGRLISPSEIADLVLSLWPHLRPLNGSIVTADGGIHLT
jgi:2-hydroxycyclohexanecarboxyl-CoA dehydrogenase